MIETKAPEELLNTPRCAILLQLIKKNVKSIKCQKTVPRAHLHIAHFVQPTVQNPKIFSL